MTRVLAIGDPHFKVDELGELDDYISQVVHIAREEKCDFIVVLGDVLHDHEKINTLALNKACKFIYELSVIAKTFVLVGNHDMINASQFLTENHWMNPLKSFPNVTIVDKLCIYKEFAFLPFVPNGRFKEALNIDLETISCIFAHQEFKGCKMGGLVSEDGDLWDRYNPLVITGHIHDKQQPQENIIYVGSSRQHSFAENADKSISLFVFNDIIERKEIFLDLPKKRIKYMNIEKVMEYKIKDNFRDRLKICVKCSPEEFKIFRKSDKYKELTKNKIKIEYKRRYTDIESNYSILKKKVSFWEIFHEIISNEKNDLLLQIYNQYIQKNFFH